MADRRISTGGPEASSRPAGASSPDAKQRLSELLSRHFGLEPADREDLASGAEWHVLGSGDLTRPLLASDPDRDWLILSGRLLDESTEDVLGPGAFLRAGRAVRPLLLAGLEKEVLDRVATRAMSLALARALATPDRRDPANASVVAVIASPGLDPRYEVSRLADGLARLGSVTTLWPRRVDRMLSSEGISQSEVGDPGDFAVSELLHELEETCDSLVLEVGSRPTAWSRRALEWADEILVVVRSGCDPAGLGQVAELVDHAPPSTDRVLVCLGGDRAPSGTGALIDATQCHTAVHLDESNTRDPARIARVVTGKARGLVLSGGGARGFAHLGVYRALDELGVEIDVFGGSSIGTPLAAGMADAYPPDELEALVSRLFANVLDYTVPLAAVTAGRGITTAAEEAFGDRAIEDLKLSFFGLSTNLTEADVHIHRRGSVVHAIRASCAVPGFMPPVPHDGDLLVDGGITNNLPVDVMREFAPRGEIIAVDVAPARGPSAREELGLWVSGVKLLRERIRGRRSAPPISMTLMRALTVGSGRRHKEMSLVGMSDRLLELDIEGAPMFAFDRVEDIAQRGYEQALPEIHTWLEEGGFSQEGQPCGS